MSRAGAPLAAAVLFVLLASPLSSAHACQPVASWLLALRNVPRPSHGGFPDDFFERMFRRVGAPPFYAVPALGPAPLALRLVFYYKPLEEPASVELAIDRDGKPEARPPIGRYNEHAKFTLSREGRYDVTARVRRADRSDFVAVAVVTVLSRAAFEQRLRADWATFTNRVLSGDHRRALDCISVFEGERDELRMRTLGTALGRAGRAPGPPKFSRIDGQEAHFTVPWVDEGGQPYDAAGKFVPDLDGVWRLVL